MNAHNPSTTPPRARELLDFFFSTAAKLSEREAHDIWCILTALRGPDMANVEGKDKGTGVVRREVCRDLAQRCGAIVSNNKTEAKAQGDLHYKEHIEAALRALTRLGYFPEKEEWVVRVEWKGATPGRGPNYLSQRAHPSGILNDLHKAARFSTAQEAGEALSKALKGLSRAMKVEDYESFWIEKAPRD